MNKIYVLLYTSLFSLVSCSQEKSITPDKYTDETIQTYYIKSGVSEQILPISLPACVITNLSSIPPNKQQIADIKNNNWINGIDLRTQRLAFSQPQFPAKLQCGDKQNSYSAIIYAIYPLNENEKKLFKSDLFQYSIEKNKSLGARYLDSKNYMDLYKVSPVNDAIFVGKDFPGNTRPLSIMFIRFDPRTPNSSFRYYFTINTYLKGEFWLRYTVIATAKDPSQFAEKLRNLIEKNQNVLDYPDVVAGFVENNEKIADFFENQKRN